MQPSRQAAVHSGRIAHPTPHPAAPWRPAAMAPRRRSRERRARRCLRGWRARRARRLGKRARRGGRLGGALRTQGPPLATARARARIKRRLCKQAGARGGRCGRGWREVYRETRRGYREILPLQREYIYGEMPESQPTKVTEVMAALRTCSRLTLGQPWLLSARLGSSRAPLVSSWMISDQLRPARITSDHLGSLGASQLGSSRIISRRITSDHLGRGHARRSRPISADLAHSRAVSGNPRLPRAPEASSTNRTFSTEMPM